MNRFQEYVTSHLSFLSNDLDHEVEKLTNCLLSKINTSSVIYTLGNGGSHATAEHFSADINLTLQRTGKSLRSVCVSSQNSTFTALANDYSYSEAFELYLHNFVTSEDVVVAFTASGNSENILRALKMTSRITPNVFALTGFDGGESRKIAGVNLIHIETPMGEYGIVENLQLSLCHYVIDQITRFPLN